MWHALPRGGLSGYERIARQAPDSSEQALLFVEEIRERLSVISLTSEEYFLAIQETAGRGFTSSRIYDGLLLKCASKWKAEAIYSWNLKHCQALAPDAAARIQNP
jgi:predicted nucleic acid-binding protein